MRQVDILRCLRAHDEAKTRLAKAEKKMHQVRNFMSHGHKFPISFGLNTQFIIDAISEFKKAHYAYEELFIDREWERQMEDARQLSKAQNECYRMMMEYLMDADKPIFLGEGI